MYGPHNCRVLTAIVNWFSSSSNIPPKAHKMMNIQLSRGGRANNVPAPLPNAPSSAMLRQWRSVTSAPEFLSSMPASAQTDCLFQILYPLRLYAVQPRFAPVLLDDSANITSLPQINGLSSNIIQTSRATMSAQDKSTADAKKHANIRYPFWFGGSASCMAATVTHPLDLGMFTLFLIEFIMIACSNCIF